MTRSLSDFNVLSGIKGSDVFEDTQKIHVNACFFMPCTDQGRKVALSVVSMFTSQGYRAHMSSAPGTKADLGRYEVNACDVPQGLIAEIEQIFKDQLEDISRLFKAPAEKLGYGHGFHEVQDKPEFQERRARPR